MDLGLLLAVLIVIYTIYSLKEKKKQEKINNDLLSRSLVKTNASLELKIMKDFFETKKYDFDTAFDETRKQMYDLGYTPVLTRDAYKYAMNMHEDGTDNRSVWTRKDVCEYDSSFVKKRKEKARKKWDYQKNNGCVSGKYEENYDDIYKNYPQSIYQMKAEYESSPTYCGLFDKGTIVTINKTFDFGLYEVVDIDFNTDEYILKHCQSKKNERIKMNDVKKAIY